jgi:predicted O-linked N-acetylglucosamine transferase (SPINDLY family)
VVAQPVPVEPPASQPNAAEEEAQIDQALNLQASGDLAQAMAGFQRVLDRNPSNWKALYSLFVIELKTGHLDASLAYVDRAIAVEPAQPISHYGRGGVLRTMERLAESLASYDQAIALQPDYPSAYVNRGAVLVEQNRITEAVANFEQLLAMHPDNTRGLGNRGSLLTVLNRNEEAILLFTKLLKLDPHYNNAEGLLAHARSRTCDWTEFKKQQKRIVDGVRKGLRVCNPLAFKSLSDSAADQFQCAKIFAAHHYPTAPAKLWNGESYGHTKLRIAYVSPDFREHPVAHLMAGVLEQHDKNRFETYGFILGIDPTSKLNQRILNSFDQCFDVRGKDSRSIADQMRSLEIDIAVDLAGYTEGCRPEIFAWRPAPIHINYLGYPGTMGSAHMDYIMADKHVIPPENFAYYSEKVIHLPGTYLPSDDSLKIPTEGITRQMAGLPEQGFVFCCFNHEYKINPDMFDVWMRLLKNVPGSVLWLMKINPTAAANLAKEAKKRGVDPARLVFAQRVPRVEDHLARYQLADLFLDTTPYNAHSTASDVLRAGLPLITCTGSSFASRVASSILHTIGVPELSTNSLAAYEAAALMYARKPDELKAVREKLRVLNAQERLGTTQFCRDLEAAYLQCSAAAQS